MHTLLVLLRKDFKNFFRNRAAVSLTFLVPFAMIYVFGQVFGVNKKDGGPSGIPLAVVNESDNPAAQRLIDSLRAEKAFRVITEQSDKDHAARPLQESDLRPLMHENKFRFALVIPRDLVSSTTLGLHLKIYSNPRNEIETQMVNGILQKTLFASVPQLLGQSLQARAQTLIGSDKLKAFNRATASNVASAFGGNAEEIERQIAEGHFGLGQVGEAPNTAPGTTAASADTHALLEKIIRIEVEQVAGKDVKSPAATRLVGGFAMQFLLFALSGSAAALFYERDRGIFHRILAGPVFRSQILWSKFIYGATLGLLQLTVLFIGGRVLFGIDIEHHIGFLVIVCTFAAAACTAFGMLLASVVSSAEAANGLSTFVILLMCSVGGAWFPVSMMPQFIQHLSHLTVVYWAMEGFDQVLWLNGSFADLLPTLGVLAGITAGIMAIAVWRFNRGNLFA
jgi:ABC-2 type transport system permease protein